MHQKYDFLIIGSGIAGLSVGLKLAEYGSVCILTKSNEDESNTKYAQGGIAVVTDFLTDSFEKHISDTLICGDGGCNEAAVNVVVTEGPDRLNEIIAYGASFDKTTSGSFDLAKEGGHGESRVLHFKDVTGKEIERTLLEQIAKTPQIALFAHKFAIDLLTEHHLGKEVTKKTDDITCFGVYAYDKTNGFIETILARKTVMATGGAGQVYANTTNPTIATGDGIAMAYRAKAKVENMEFIQFHPTALYQAGVSPSFLITEAVRGYGAVLRDTQGNEFMHRYDERLSLAPRDIVARSIHNEMITSGEQFVYLDCTNLSQEFIESHIPNIYQKCLSIGIDIRKDYIPVSPAMHYLVGGVKVNLNGETSIKNLYACGECASTGLHGANRLASNSLLEAIVFADRIYKHAKETFTASEFNFGIPSWNDEGTNTPKELSLITQNTRELQTLMSNYVGILRNNERLDRALDRLNILYKESEELYKRSKISVKLLELRNLINVAYTIIKSAKLRKESRGLHYNTDFPEKDYVYKETII